MAGALKLMRGFDGGRTIDEVQRHALGELGQDTLGNRWSYVEFQSAVNAGQWVGDGVVTSALGVGAAAVGTDDLEFDTALSADYEHIGAYGIVVAGGGAGQGFVITELDSNRTKAKIALLNTAGAGGDRVFDGSGWAVALTGASTVLLNYPGLVSPGGTGATNNPGLARGVAQVDVTSAQASGANNRGFGWVQQSGIGVCRLDASAANVAGDRRLNFAAAGLFLGGTTGTAGAYALATYNPGTDDLILARIDIENTATRWYAPAERPLGYGGELR